MKCLSLWQPWASLIVMGNKLVETRSWETKYRGPLAIHAAKRRIDEDGAHVLYCLGLMPDDIIGMASPTTGLPLGKIVAVCNLVACLPTPKVRTNPLETITLFDPRRLRNADPSVRDVTPEQQLLGDYSPGRWAWFLEDVRAIDPPVPFSGRQGLFEIDDDLVPRAVPA